MTNIQPFKAIRPTKDGAHNTSVLNLSDVQAAIESRELAEYHTAAYYIYKVESKERTQTGIFGSASVDDYAKEIIKNHETLDVESCPEKVREFDKVGLQLEPVVIAYHMQQYVERMNGLQEEYSPTYKFKAPDGSIHTVWSVDDYSKVANYNDAFYGTSDFRVIARKYIAASAVERALALRKKNKSAPGSAEYDYFMCVLLPYEEIMDGNSVVLPKFQPNLLTRRF